MVLNLEKEFLSTGSKESFELSSNSRFEYLPLYLVFEWTCNDQTSRDSGGRWSISVALCEYLDWEIQNIEFCQQVTCYQILATVVYRLTLHPLAKYPGPLLGKIADWYTIYHSWKGDRHLDFYRLHQNYGMVSTYRKA